MNILIGTRTLVILIQSHSHHALINHIYFWVLLSINKAITKSINLCLQPFLDSKIRTGWLFINAQFIRHCQKSLIMKLYCIQDLVKMWFAEGIRTTFLKLILLLLFYLLFYIAYNYHIFFRIKVYHYRNDKTYNFFEKRKNGIFCMGTKLILNILIQI